MKNQFLLPALLFLASCVSVSTVPMANDLVQVTASVDLECGAASGEKIALRQAAVETIQRGYDRFYVVDSQARDDVRVVGVTPTQSTTTSNVRGRSGYGRSTWTETSATVTTGGTPIYGGNLNRTLTVKMLRAGDAEAANALDARQVLGPDWQKKLTEKKSTCF